MTDTGGHYLEGSTDITRTVALGEVGNIEKNISHWLQEQCCAWQTLYFSMDAVVRIWIVLQERSLERRIKL